MHSYARTCTKYAKIGKICKHEIICTPHFADFMTDNVLAVQCSKLEKQTL